jgi:hypothetical protein
MMAPKVMFLYPRKGNCHTFVADPCGAAVLDQLFPPYNKGNGRERVCINLSSG